MRMIFVNLPVADIARATAFYEALGFARNPTFCSDDTSCIVVSETIYFMLLEHDRFRGFINGDLHDARTGTDKLICLTCDSAEEVSALKDKALAAGGAAWRPDMTDIPGMVQASFTDPDGHVVELVWMSQEAVQQAEAGAAA
jgi:uncharacterized protein